jgi:hypothetical protein
MLLQQPDPGFDSSGQKAVVVIEKQNVLALAVADTRIAGSGDTAICLVNVMNTVRSCNSGGLIRRAIIDHYDFNPGIALRQGTVDGIGKIAG